MTIWRLVRVNLRDFERVEKTKHSVDCAASRDTYERARADIMGPIRIGSWNRRSPCGTAPKSDAVALSLRLGAVNQTWNNGRNVDRRPIYGRQRVRKNAPRKEGAAEVPIRKEHLPDLPGCEKADSRY